MDPLNFVTDLHHYLDTKINQRSALSCLLIVTCLGGGVCSPSALVFSVAKVRRQIMAVMAKILY